MLMNPDDIEALDQFIDEVVIGDKEITISNGIQSGKSTLSLVWFLKLSDRMRERKLLPIEYQHKEIKSLQAEVLEYTGSCVQQEMIKKWMPDRKFYFCYDSQKKWDYMFSPGYSNNTKCAIPGDYLVLTKAGGLDVISKQELESEWYQIENIIPCK